MKVFAPRWRSPLWLSLSAIALGACYPDPLTTSETDVVITVREPDRSYSSLQTYAVADQVFDLCELREGIGAGGAGGDEEGSECRDIDHRYDQQILDAIAANLEQLGFEKATPEEDADVVVVPAVTAQDNWYVYYPYCDYWYPYYWNPYCWYYPWTPTAVNYPVGTLVMYMIAPKEADEEAKRMPVTWLGVVRGILNSASNVNADRAEAGVDQAFAQSQYLGEGK